MIPLLVTIENKSARPLRLRYTEFALVGVLEPSGRMTGFLYFEDVDIGDTNGDDDMGRFLMDLVDASTTRALGTISIPLEID